MEPKTYQYKTILTLHNRVKTNKRGEITIYARPVLSTLLDPTIKVDNKIWNDFFYLNKRSFNQAAIRTIIQEIENEA